MLLRRKGQRANSSCMPAWRPAVARVARDVDGCTWQHDSDLCSCCVLICACGVSQCHGCGHVKSGSLVEANSHKSFDGFSPQQSGRDGMFRHAALSASLQDTVGRPWHGQTNHVFGLVMFKPMLHPDLGTLWFDLLQRSARLSQCR